MKRLLLNPALPLALAALPMAALWTAGAEPAGVAAGAEPRPASAAPATGFAVARLVVKAS